MSTAEFVVLEMSEKDFECKDGKVRHYYNVKVGSADYENITLSIKEDMYNALQAAKIKTEKEDPQAKTTVIFIGHFGGMKTQFWGIDKIYSINGKQYKPDPKS